MSALLSITGDGLDALDDGIDLSQAIANDAESLRTIVSGLEDLAAFLQLFPPARTIARKVEGIIEKVETRAKDLEDKAEDVEDILKTFERGVTVMSTLNTAAQISVRNDLGDINAALAGVEDLQRALDLPSVGRPPETEEAEARLEARLADLNAEFPAAKLQEMRANAQLMRDTFETYTEIGRELSKVASGFDAVIDRLGSLAGPLRSVSDVLSPVTWVLDKAASVIDFVVSPILDPILDALGINALLDNVTNLVTGLLPDVSLFTRSTICRPT